MSLFPWNSQLIECLSKRPKCKLRITVFHGKNWKTGNIALNWQGGIDKRMTLEDGETDEFLILKLKRSLNIFARKYTKQPRIGDFWGNRHSEVENGCNTSE